MGKARICIITTAHEPRDDRVFHKEALALARSGYAVSLIAGWDAEIDSGPVRKLPLPPFRGKLDRMFRGAGCAFRLALRERADAYHFHDPELLAVGVALKLFGKRVIYDVHEDYSKKMLSRRLPQIVRIPASWIMRAFEAICAWSFDRVVAADSHVASLFAPAKTVVIANYPPLDFVQRAVRPQPRDLSAPFRIVYVGGINLIRGIGKIVDAVELIHDRPVEFHLAGNVTDAALLARLQTHPRVVYHGVLPWEEVNQVIAQADVGMVLFQPVPAFEYYPGENIIKLWEYLGIGLPVIISNFPKLQTLITALDAGLAVDPADPAAIATAIKHLRDHPELRRRLGDNGRRAVLQDRNWESQAVRLGAMYRQLLGEPAVLKEGAPCAQTHDKFSTIG